MNELEVTRAVHQYNSQHRPKIEVLLENKDDLHHLQINVSNPHLYESVQLETNRLSCFLGPQSLPCLMLYPEAHTVAVNGKWTEHGTVGRAQNLELEVRF